MSQSSAHPSVRGLAPPRQPHLERRLFPAVFDDPWEFAPPEGLRWHDGTSGLRFAAWGEARALACHGAARFDRAQRWCSSSIERWRGSDVEGLPAAMLAFAFGEDGPAGDASWRGWPAAWLWIPRFLAFYWPGHTPERGLVVHGATPRLPSAWPSPAPSAEVGYRRVAEEQQHQRYVRDVRAIVNDIAEGRLEKVVLGRRAALETAGRFDVARTLARLDGQARAAVSFALWRGDEAFVGSTPEVLARVSGGRLETHALAGTAQRGGGVLGSDKDVREHRFVLDALIAGLSRLCTEVHVDEPLIAPAGHVEHIGAALRGRLMPGVDLLAAAQALHPTPALGGSPSAAALAWLAAHEPFDRGYYGGLVGWLAPSGDGVLAVAIRSALVARARALLFAGAGIVAGSDAEAEWRETESKLETMLASICAVEEERA